MPGLDWTSAAGDAGTLPTAAGYLPAQRQFRRSGSGCGPDRSLPAAVRAVRHGGFARRYRS
ncbi:MAG: hypothetical protein RML15_07875 [Bacteroidota bacterium]|nr:hypothetical protein [Candidatus Kapabacteria bacterium]MDW8272306.1 hypothetical protein [Bacteroidota bacterium]